MSVHTRWDHHVATMTLRGALDVTSAPQARRHLAEILSEDPRQLIMDVTGVAFMDCQGARLIAQASRGLPARRQVILRGASGPVRRILALTGVAQACTIESQQPALAALG